MLYGHVFRNAMLIVVAGFPGAFISILFASSLLIEVIFSLDGLGLLGFEAAINRDYPVMFGTLFFFTLLGLLLNLVGDLMYVVIDPRVVATRKGVAGPIKTPDQMKGIKFRVPGSKILAQFYQLLGANPTPVAWGETSSAIKQGVADALEQLGRGELAAVTVDILP